ncbi:hypothetical protein [Mycobacterium marinum]|uniref:hypothetical protein n=1 Tax=Mycobacterium marinum TaxID=1781 RepID=UPI003566EB55
MTNHPNVAPPSDWNWAKDGSWIFCAHGDDVIPIYAQARQDVEPRLIGAYTPQRALGLALGLLQAIGGLAEHQQRMVDELMTDIARLELGGDTNIGDMEPNE